MTTQALQFVCFNHSGDYMNDAVNDWLQAIGPIDIVNINQSCVAIGRDHEDTEVVISIFYRQKAAPNDAPEYGASADETWKKIASDLFGACQPETEGT